ncbi:unnamed protein product [Allacma fusca]|uniref:DUF5641 domain-containing protein n=1 Tax=Allacma fusca TaxID=39272 RepID=A0A8J2K2L0_9HEXA|nr:unnamed protein product [Allacma fusca]
MIKWKTSEPNQKEGDTVVVRDHHSPPQKWKLARIVNLHPKKADEQLLVRSVTVRTKDGLMKSPITRLVLLPKNSDLTKVAANPLEQHSPAMPDEPASRTSQIEGHEKNDEDKEANLFKSLETLPQPAVSPKRGEARLNSVTSLHWFLSFKKKNGLLLPNVRQEIITELDFSSCRMFDILSPGSGEETGTFSPLENKRIQMTSDFMFFMLMDLTSGLYKSNLSRNGITGRMNVRYRQGLGSSRTWCTYSSQCQKPSFWEMASTTSNKAVPSISFVLLKSHYRYPSSEVGRHQDQAEDLRYIARQRHANMGYFDHLSPEGDNRNSLNGKPRMMHIPVKNIIPRTSSPTGPPPHSLLDTNGWSHIPAEGVADFHQHGPVSILLETYIYNDVIRHQVSSSVKSTFRHFGIPSVWTPIAFTKPSVNIYPSRCMTPTQSSSVYRNAK